MPSLRVKKDDQDKMHFVTLTVIEWINIFTKLEYFEVLINSLKYCQKHKGLQIFGYVIMTNHMHTILKALNGNLSQVIADFKRFTTSKIFKLLKYDNRKYIQRLIKNSYSKKKWYKSQIWQRENYPVDIETEQFFEQKLHYIHENPVRECYVDQDEEWRFSSARNYLKGDHSVIKVETDYWKYL